MRLVKLTGEAERATQTTVDTIEVTKKLAAAWKSPPFQRELRTPPKVLALSEEIRTLGVLPGMITLGVLDGDVYIVDGQHRLHAFTLADLPVVYADVRTHYFKTMGEMAAEFVRLNSSLVRLRADDILKGMEQSNPHLQRIRRRCPFVGYDRVRINDHAPVLSMSTVMRVWAGSRPDVPSYGGLGSTGAVELLTDPDTQTLIDYLNLCFTAWKRDAEYSTLWGSLNLILCAWLYRRIVVGEGARPGTRAHRIDADQFRRCLMSLSAEHDYVDFLRGRRVTDRDRSPAYSRLKSIFAKRYWDEHRKKLQLPGPSWAHQRGRGGI